MWQIANKNKLTLLDFVIKSVYVKSKHSFAFWVWLCYVCFSMDKIEKYQGLLKILALKYKHSGIEEDDLMQEGNIALLKALETFKEGKGAKFETYLTACVNNRLIDVIRKKQKDPEYEHEQESDDPEEISKRRGQLDEIFKLVKDSFTDIEQKIWLLSLQGFTYTEIAKRIEKPAKKVDNILQKIKTAIKNKARE